MFLTHPTAIRLQDPAMAAAILSQIRAILSMAVAILLKHSPFFRMCWLRWSATNDPPVRSASIDKPQSHFALLKQAKRKEKKKKEDRRLVAD